MTWVTKSYGPFGFPQYNKKKSSSRASERKTFGRVRQIKERVKILFFLMQFNAETGRVHTMASAPEHEKYYIMKEEEETETVNPNPRQNRKKKKKYLRLAWM